MYGGFRTLLHPATRAGDIDVDGTRRAREAMRERLYPTGDRDRSAPVGVLRRLSSALRRGRRWGR